MHGRALLFLGLVAVVLVGPASGRAVMKPKVTVIGDSVADKIRPNADQVAELGAGFRLNLQTRGCRATVIPSCTVAGNPGPPPTVLDVVNRFGRWLGRVVVIETGYNDTPAQYGADVDAVMAALQYWQVKTVVWLTLHDPRPDYQGMNAVIRAAPKHWPQMVVADWGGYAAGHADWFAPDGIHPTPLGAGELAVFIHAAVVRALVAH
jgi:hypothetical protein